MNTEITSENGLVEKLRIAHIALAFCDEYNPRVIGAMFATGHPYCMGKTMSDAAYELRVSKATISYWANQFCKSARIPKSQYMRDQKPKTKVKK